MSESMYRSRIEALRREIVQLERRRADARAREARLRAEAGKAKADAGKSSTESRRRNKTGEAERKERSASEAAARAADAEKRLTAKTKALFDTERSLEKVRLQDARQTAVRSEKEARDRDREVRRLLNRISELEESGSSVKGFPGPELAKAALPKQITVLVIFADPERNLDLAEEARSIQQVIRLSEHRDHIKLETRWAARPGDLTQALIETRPTVVHISGHGVAGGALVFQGEDGEERLVAGEAVAGLIAAVGEKVRLIVLNSCYSQDAAAAIALQVEAAIGMDVAIEDAGARHFAQGLYRGIGAGKSLEAAFTAALFEYRAEVSGSPGAEPGLFTAPGASPSAIFLVAPDGQ